MATNKFSGQPLHSVTTPLHSTGPRLRRNCTGTRDARVEINCFQSLLSTKSTQLNVRDNRKVPLKSKSLCSEARLSIALKHQMRSDDVG
jgi:hypothetical protein